MPQTRSSSLVEVGFWGVWDDWLPRVLGDNDDWEDDWEDDDWDPFLGLFFFPSPSPVIFSLSSGDGQV